MTNTDGGIDIETYARILKILLEPFESDPITYNLILRAILDV